MPTKLKIGRGIESIGETWFATVYWTAASVQRCLPAFTAIVENQDLGIDLSVHQTMLHCHCISLTLPPGPKWNLRRGVQWCPLVSYCADQDYDSPGTYCESHSMSRIGTYNIKLSQASIEGVRAIINKCFDEIIDKSHNNSYVPSFFLDPCQ